MKHLARRVLAVRIVVALAVVVLAGCKDKSVPDPATAQDVTRPANGRLIPLPKQLDELLANEAEFNAYIAKVRAEAKMGDNVPGRRIRSTQPSSQCGIPYTSAFVKATAYGTAGDYTYDQLTNPNLYGYAIAEVRNEAKCKPDYIKLNGASSNSVPSVTIWFIAKSPTGEFQSRLIDADSLKDVPGAPRRFLQCPSNATHPSNSTPYASKAYPKRASKVCEAINLVTQADSVAFNEDPPIDERWTLWITCAQECCYADE